MACSEIFSRIRIVGFTLVEMVVASVVMSICLIGFYSFVKQPLSAETEITRKHQAQQLAAAVVNQMADSMEQALCLPDAPTFSAGTDSQGHHELTCVASGPPLPEQPNIQLNRYTWGPSADQDGIEVRMQRRLFFGSKEVSAGQKDQLDADNWQSITPQLVGQGLSKFSVQFRPLAQSGDQWLDRWSGASGQVAIRVHAEVADQAVERIVVPPVNAPFAKSDKGS